MSRSWLNSGVWRNLMRFGVGFDCAVGRVLGKQGTTLYNKTLAVEPTLYMWLIKPTPNN